jgi:hypothetical protein
VGCPFTPFLIRIDSKGKPGDFYRVLSLLVGEYPERWAVYVVVGFVFRKPESGSHVDPGYFIHFDAFDTLSLENMYSY